VWNSLKSFAGRHVDLLACLLLSGMAFVFMGAALFPAEGRMLYGFDVERLFYPFGEFMFAAFREGRLPLWNPYVFLGFPQYAEPQLSVFYPVTWLLTYIPASSAYALQYAIHFAWAAVGGYVFARRLGAKWSGAFFGGLAIAYALTMTVRIFVGHMPHVMTLAWMPWVLAAAHWAVQRRTWTATIIAGVPLGMAFLIGYIPFLILMVPVLVIYMLWLAGRAWFGGDRPEAVRIVVQLAGIGLFAALLAAVQLLPSLEFALNSNRAADRYNFSDSYSIQWSFLLTSLMPDLFGAPQGTVELWLQELPGAIYWEWALYGGILPLILFLLAWSVGKKAWRFWVVLGVIGILLALGDKGVFHRLLYDYLPGWSAFRFASRPVYLFNLALAVLAGLMLDRWYDLPVERHTRLAGHLKKGLIVVGGLLAILIVLSVFWRGVQTEPEAIKIAGAISEQLMRLLLFTTASLGLLIWGYGRPRWLFAGLAILILVVDLWGQGNKFITDIPQEPELGWVMADLALPENRLDYRVLSKAMSENSGYFYDFYSIYGYDGFTLEASEKLHDLAVTDARVVRMLSGQYLLHGPWWELPVIAPGWEVLTEPAGVTIYERYDAGPRAFVVHEVVGVADEEEAVVKMGNPELDFTQTAVVQALPDTSCALEPADPAQSSATITSYDPERVVIEAQAPAGGWLVLNDLYYPGWQARVNDQPAVIQPTNFALRGVCIPAGASEVVFEFQPAILRYGALISAASLLLLLVALIIEWRRKPTPETIHEHGHSPA
jgi:hypothetical protein